MANTLENILLKPHSAHGDALVKIEGERNAEDAGTNLKDLEFILAGKAIPAQVAAYVLALGRR